MRPSILSLLLVALTACGGTPRPKTVVQPQTQGARRINGLRVETAPRPGAGVVAIHLRLPAGSLHETPSGAGAAHAAARWILGDSRRGLQEAIARIGGVARAWTSRNATSFEVVVAADQTGEALKLIARALAAPNVDRDGWVALSRRLDAEQQQARLSDARRAIEVSVADLFDKHPLARAPLPDSVALRTLQPKAITAYVERRYRPDGAVLVLAGDVDDGVEGQVKAAFAGWKGRAAVVQHPPLTPPGDLNVRAVGTRDREATIALSFLAEAQTPEDTVALDLARAALEERVTAALARLGITTRPQAVVATPGDAGFLTVLAKVPAERVDPAWRALIGAAVREAGAPWSDARFKALKAQVDGVAEALDGSVEGQARRLAAVRSRWPDGGDDAWRSALAMIGPDDLASTERRLLRLERASAVILAPDRIRTDDDGPWLQSLTEQAVRLARPDSGLAPGRHAVSEGFEAIVHPMKAARQVGVALWLAGGARAVRARHAGLAALVARGMAQPTPGAPRLEVTAEPEGILLRAEVPAADLDATLRLIAQRVTALTWDAAAVEAARRPRPADLDDLLLRTAGVDLQGTPETLGQITPAAVQRWYSTYVREAPLVLSLAGAVDRRALTGLALRFGRRRPAAQVKPTAPKAGTVDQPTDLGQGRLAWRWPVAPKQRAAVSLVLSTLMAPDASARSALTGLGARVDSHLGAEAITVVLTAPGARFAAAEAALRKGLDELRTLPVDGDLLAQVKQREAARLLVRLRRPGLRAAWLLDQARAGQPFTGPDALDAWRATLEAVSPDAVSKSARDDLSRARRVEVRLTPRRRGRRKGS